MANTWMKFVKVKSVSIQNKSLELENYMRRIDKIRNCYIPLAQLSQNYGASNVTHYRIGEILWCVSHFNILTLSHIFHDFYSIP